MKISNFDPHGKFGLMLPKPVGERLRQNDTGRFKNYRPMKLQRGNLNMLYALFSDEAAAGSVVLTTHSLTETNGGGLCHNGPAFHQDGTLNEVGSGLADRASVTAGEWWSDEPETDIGADYDVRALSAGKTGTWTISAASDDAWVQIDVERLWRVTVTAKLSPASKDASATFEIRATGSGSALDSAVISASANN